MTYLDKTKNQIIYELLLSLNEGNCGYVDSRVDYAMQQYEQLRKNGIVR